MNKYSFNWLLVLGIFCAVFGFTYSPSYLTKEVSQNLLQTSSLSSQQPLKKTANGKPFFDTSVTFLEAMVLGVEIFRLLKDKH